MLHCIIAFEERDEYHIERLPLWFGSYDHIVDNFTVSKHCQAIEELITCFGKDYAENCLDDSNNLLQLYNNGDTLRDIVIRDRMICRNKNNEISSESVVCMLKTMAGINVALYQCEGLHVDSNVFNYLEAIRVQIIICKLLEVDKKCGRGMANVLCSLLIEESLNINCDWWGFPYDCDTYVNRTCECSEIGVIW